MKGEYPDGWPVLRTPLQLRNELIEVIEPFKDFDFVAELPELVEYAVETKCKEFQVDYKVGRFVVDVSYLPNFELFGVYKQHQLEIHVWLYDEIKEKEVLLCCLNHILTSPELKNGLYEKFDRAIQVI